MSVLDNIRIFWDRFEDEQDTLLEALKARDYDRLSEVLELLDQESNRISGAHFFVEDSFDVPEMTFDAGPNKTSQLICRQMKELAPDTVKSRWIINDSLPPLSQKAVEASLQIKDEHYSLFDMTAFYQVSQKSQNISVQVYCPGFSMIDNPEYKREMAIYLVELAVGENVLESYISSVDFLDLPENGVDFCNLTELYEVIIEIADRSGWKKYAHPLDVYTAFKPHEDFASDSLRKDMKLIFTTHPSLIEESLAGASDVQSDLKAKQGEYGYIYYANPFDDRQDAVIRQELSRKLESLFAPTHCARVIGGAIGKSFSYIDLILYDPDTFEKVFEQIRSQLGRNIELHYRSFAEE